MKITTKKPFQMKKTEINLPARLQQVFIAALGLSWLISLLTMVIMYTGNRGYLSSGTWTFQLSVWIYPVVYMVTAFFFIRKRYRTGLGRLFSAGIIGQSGLFLYQALYSVWTALSFHYQWFMNQTSNSVWAAFGREWVAMIVGFALFMGALGLVDRRWKTKK